jgi:opacity protein-like surface antigen
VKRSSVFTALILCATLGAAVSAGAQAATVLKPVQLGVALGGAIPLSDFGKTYSTGYNFTGTIGFNPTGMPIGFRFDGAYNQFGSKGTPKVNAKIASVTGSVVFSMTGTPEVTPYLIGGVGYYHSSSSISGTKASNNFGFNAGGGIKVPLSGFNVFAEARYNHFNDNGATIKSVGYVPITVGVMF